MSGGNVIAGLGQVFVCFACGKMSYDKFGDDPISRGWDVSCMMNSVLCTRESLVIVNERVVKAVPVEAITVED